MKILLILTSLLIVGLSHNLRATTNSSDKKSLAHLTNENLDIDSELSLNYARKLEALAKAEKDTTYLLYALNVQGVIFNRHVNYSAALRVLEKANNLQGNNSNVLFDLANTHRLAGSERRAL
jgi:hypothetical protein